MGECSAGAGVGPRLATGQRHGRVHLLLDCSLLAGEVREGIPAALGLRARLLGAVEQVLRSRVLGFELPLSVADLDVEALHVFEVASHGGQSAGGGGTVGRACHGRPKNAGLELSSEATDRT